MTIQTGTIGLGLGSVSSVPFFSGNVGINDNQFLNKLDILYGSAYCGWVSELHKARNINSYIIDFLISIDPDYKSNWKYCMIYYINTTVIYVYLESDFYFFKDGNLIQVIKNDITGTKMINYIRNEKIRMILSK